MLKITNNYHTHTFRCGHADGKDEEYVLAAIKAGIKVLGFSDHMPWPGFSQPGIRMDEEMLDNYVNSISQLKEKYKDQIEIKVGLEVEFVDELVPYYRHLLEDKGIEYLIIGQHGEYDPELGFYFYNAFLNNQITLRRYFSSVIKGMESGLFKYIAHPDHALNGYRLDDAFIENQIRQICQKSKEYNVPLEVNLSYPRMAIMDGQKHDGKDSYPYDRFWKIAEEVGCPVIFGIDAHSPSHLLIDYSPYIKEFTDKFHLNIVE